MPGPYTLLDMPPGEFSNTFDFQAIHMAAAHNMFLQGFNSMIKHGPTITDEKVQPFMVFCLALLDIVHHHHTLEETYYFPALEEKLGEGALHGNVDQHDEFMPLLEALEGWCKKVQNKEEVYDGKVFVEMVNAFSDTMVEHLNDEISTLDRNMMREKFTKAELKAIDAELMKRGLADIDFYKALPMSMICVNPKTSWFPPVPAPLKWATRWWFSRRFREAWEFGPMDISGNEKST